MKSLFLMIGLSFSSLFAAAQVDTTQLLDSALVVGQRMIDAFQAEDYGTFMDHLHPRIIELTGGREGMRGLLEGGLGPNVQIISTDLARPEQLIVTDSTLQCTLPQRQVMKIDGQKMYALSTLIAISYDEGENWQYIGVAGNTLEKLQRFFPELSDDLPVQSQTPPVLMKE